ncbi:hypothetical protein [Puia dinghuensis]|uniref:BZIP transcription factor n=1 Tax=Puia dinghuensis TaxID=1792502 RepID=A0A8J2UEI4_9BACT|nr:hypothetical protein [Puia dinghuensis]GGB06539.1 hypothetical protein GCM10011511_32500 [Puia dinghuensis]
MRSNPNWKGIPYPLAAMILLSLFACLQARSQSQWAGPDGSGNIHNTNTGNVGIGTSSPAYPLDVVGNGHFSGTLFTNTGLQATGNVSSWPAGAGVQLVYVGDMGYVTAYDNTANQFKPLVLRGSNFTFQINGSTAGTVFSSGNWGLGAVTSDAGYKVDVNGSVRIQGGLTYPLNAGAGKVLTSDANGNATWQAPSSLPTSSLFLANGNTTGATQTPLSLGNWSGSQTTVPSFQFNTSDNGTSNLDLHSTRWGTQVTFTRSDPTGNSYNVMQVGGNNSVGAIASLYNTSNQVTLQLNAQGTTYFTGGNVLIGKTSQTNSGYMLDVNGVARANQVVVNTSGADFVFDSAYHLLSLPEIQKYIQAYHHLPDIAPAAEMQQKGIDLGDNQTRMLQKLEEVMLYLIQQDKELKALKEQNQRLEERNQRLEERNRALESIEQRLSRLEQSLK